MIAHRLTVVAVAVLCACALAVVGCDRKQSPGLYPISVDGKWGYVDKTGAMVIRPPAGVFVTGLGEFSDGLATALSTDYQVGYIDKTGAMAIEPRFKEAQAFSEGLAAVSLDGSKWGYIDTDGAYAIEQQFEVAWPFSEGLAAVAVEENGFWRFGYVDRGGRWKIELPLNVHVGEDSEFSDGLALAEIMGEGYPFPTYGYVDKRGKWAIEPQFARASRFVEGLAAAAVLNEAFDPPPPEHSPYYDEDADPKLLWGFIDKKGRWVVEPQYYSVQSFDETGKVIWQEQ